MEAHKTLKHFPYCDDIYDLNIYSHIPILTYENFFIVRFIFRIINRMTKIRGVHRNWLIL